MARGRMIYREFFTSEDVTGLPAPARLLFAGLIVFSDDDGTIRYSERFFTSVILCGLGTKAGRLRTWIGQLEDRQCIERVQTGNVTRLRITNFSRFQRLSEAKRSEDELKRSEAKATKAIVRDSQSLPEGKAAENETAARHETNGHESNQTEAYLRMLSEWGSDAADIPKARRMLEQSGGATNDCVAAWRRCRQLAGSQATIKKPDAFCRLKALRWAHPDEAGLDFWKAAGAGARKRAAKGKSAAPEPVGNAIEDFKRKHGLHDEPPAS